MLEVRHYPGKKNTLALGRGTPNKVERWSKYYSHVWPKDRFKTEIIYDDTHGTERVIGIKRETAHATPRVPSGEAS